MPQRPTMGRLVADLGEHERTCFLADWNAGKSMKWLEAEYRLTKAQIESLCRALDAPKRRGRGTRHKVLYTSVAVRRDLMAAVRRAAHARGMAYASFVNYALEIAVADTRLPLPPMKFPKSPTVYQR